MGSVQWKYNGSASTDVIVALQNSLQPKQLNQTAPSTDIPHSVLTEALVDKSTLSQGGTCSPRACRPLTACQVNQHKLAQLSLWRGW
jgi:hypothetical protein